MGLQAQEKEIVVPGQILADGMDYLPSHGTYRQGDNIIACRLGLLVIDGKVLKTIPLAGRYLPKRNDIIVGRVIDIMLSGWRIETNSPYSAMLNVKDATFEFIGKQADLSRYFALDDYVVSKIVNVTTQNLVDLTCKGPGLRKLKGGRIIEVNTHKVPRIIGKKGSMVSMIKNATNCKITVGQNGKIWLSGDPDQEMIAITAIKKIEAESHRPGLTERIQRFLSEATGKDVSQMQNDRPENGEEGSEHDNQE
ncbi:MAG: exosome complex RNA-binding protein Rrp4 [Nanoarchaeota archaeon]